MPYSKATSKYSRVLLKLSGEALGIDGVGIDPKILDRTALEVGQLISIGVQVGPSWAIVWPSWTPEGNEERHRSGRRQPPRVA